jgi:excisionase family DNA binding protein
MGRGFSGGGWSNIQSANASAEVEPLLTESEVARRLRIARSVLFALRSSGKLGYVRVGRSIRYTPAQVAAFVRQHSQEAR